MNFFKVEYLFLIWVVPLLLLITIYGMKRRRRILSQFATPQGLRAISPRPASSLRGVKAGLLLTGALLMILAISGPRYGYTWEEVRRKGIDIIIALDCSRSMLAQDTQPTRLDRAKREVYDLLTMLRGDRVGLVAFAGTAFLQCPLTLDYDAFHLFLTSLTPDYLPVGGSAVAEAVRTATASFDKKTNAEKAVILITDGENTGTDDPVSAAKAAREAGIKLFCIGVGGDEGAPIPETQGGFKKEASGKIVLSRLDENALKQMAAITQGAYVRSVAGDMDLDLIYEKKIRDRMEQTALFGGRKKVWEDRYQWMLGLAVILIALDLFVPAVKRNHHLTALGLAFLICLTPATGRAESASDGLDAYQKGDYEKALNAFIKAQVKDPENPNLFYNLGNAYYKNGDFDAAHQHYLQALKSEDSALKQKSYYNLGNTSFRKGDLAAAEKNYEQALALDPDDLQAKENLAFVKEVMARQKQQPQGQQGDKDQGQQKDSQSREHPPTDQKDETESQNQQPADSPETKEGDTPSENAASPEFGNEMKDNAQLPRPENSEPEAGSGQQKSQDQATAASTDDTNQGPQSLPSEKLLNRLEDRPGKAMIPFYREHTVEKDW